MAAWKYVKGSESDFLGAPEWSTCVVIFEGQILYEEHAEPQIGLSRWQVDGEEDVYTWDENTKTGGKVIAQRERVTSINDDRLAQDMGLNPKYNRPCKGVTIDVYDVLQAFNVTNPALQHLVKKALAVGQRGHKDKMEDLRDILASAQRAIELEESGK